MAISKGDLRDLMIETLAKCVKAGNISQANADFYLDSATELMYNGIIRGDTKAGLAVRSFLKEMGVWREPTNQTNKYGCANSAREDNANTKLKTPADKRKDAIEIAKNTIALLEETPNLSDPKNKYHSAHTWIKILKQGIDKLVLIDESKIDSILEASEKLDKLCDNAIESSDYVLQLASRKYDNKL